MPGIVEQYIQQRDRLVDDLARVTLHPEEAQQNDWQRYGELAQIDQRIQQVQSQTLQPTPDLADELARYAATHPGQAEGEIGRRMVEQMYQGSTLDLSQTYNTDDAARAEHRHAWALVNLDPFIQKAEDLGYKVERGNAIAARHHHGFEESEGFSQGVG